MSDLLRGSQRGNLKLEEFEVEGVLGEGSYGFVLLAVRDRNEFALKEMSKYRLKKFHKEHIALIEKELLRKVAHPGIIKPSGAFQTQSKLYLVLEACKGGDLQQLAKRGLSDGARRFYFAELVNTVEYLHSVGIVHRDLKPCNLLLDEQGHLKMVDFGSACVENCTLIPQAFKDSLYSMKHEKENIEEFEESPRIRKRKSTFVGTSEYMPPELLERNECEATSDLWSLGCILYFLHYGRGPFFAPCELDLYSQIRCGKVEFPKGGQASLDAEDLIRKLLVLAPEERLGSGSREELTFRQLKTHPFFAGLQVDDVFALDPPGYVNPEAQIEEKLANLNDLGKDSAETGERSMLTLYLAKKKNSIYIVFRCEFYPDLIMKEFEHSYPERPPLIYKLRKQEDKGMLAYDICPGKLKVNIETKDDETKIFYRSCNSASHCERINKMYSSLQQLEAPFESSSTDLE